MLIFDFWSATDINSGYFLGSRLDQIYNTSPYGDDAIVPWINPNVHTDQLGTVALPSPVRTWKTNADSSISTYTASEYANITVKAGAIELVYENAPNGGFVQHTIDGVGIENLSLYGSLNTTSSITIPLTNLQNQTIQIQHTGFIDKASSTVFGPFNVVGTSMAGSIHLSPNGTSIITDKWTFTGVDVNTFHLTRTGTGATNTYSYNAINTNAIPGYDVSVSSGVTAADSAYINTNAPVITLQKFITYPNVNPASGWQTPVMDSGDENTSWEFLTANIQDQSVSSSLYNNSVSTYCTNFTVGNTLPPDNTWAIIQPTETAYQNIGGSQLTPAHSLIVNSLGSIQGRYGIATISMSLYTDFIRNPKIYTWNPQFDRSYNLIGPVAGGQNLQKFIATITSTYQDKINQAQNLLSSVAVSTSEKEYLFMWGSILGFPIRRGESLDLYRARLSYLVQSAYAGSTLDFIQEAIRTYCNSSYPYILQPSPSINQWVLGQSLLGIDTYLGARSAKVWTYEVHVQGSMPGISIPDLKAFVQILNPIGAVPVFILE